MSGIAGFPSSSGGASGPRDGDSTYHAEVSAPIVVCTTQAAADFVSATLAAHGIQANAGFTYYAYPQLGWIEGYKVTVAADEEQAARELLSELERDDVHPVGPGEGPGGE